MPTYLRATYLAYAMTPASPHFHNDPLEGLSIAKMWLENDCSNVQRGRRGRRLCSEFLFERTEMNVSCVSLRHIQKYKKYIEQGKKELHGDYRYRVLDSLKGKVSSVVPFYIACRKAHIYVLHTDIWHA